MHIKPKRPSDHDNKAHNEITASSELVHEPVYGIADLYRIVTYQTISNMTKNNKFSFNITAFPIMKERHKFGFSSFFHPY